MQASAFAVRHHVPSWQFEHTHMLPYLAWFSLNRQVVADVMVVWMGRSTI